MIEPLLVRQGAASGALACQARGIKKAGSGDSAQPEGCTTKVVNISYICIGNTQMIGYNYKRKPITGERAKQIAKNHPQSPGDTKVKTNPHKLPDKFSVPWK